MPPHSLSSTTPRIHNRLQSTLFIRNRIPPPTFRRVPLHRVPSRARNRNSRVMNHERPVGRCRPGLRIVGKTGAGDVVTVIVTSVGESGHETARAREKGANGREAGGEKPVALGENGVEVTGDLSVAVRLGARCRCVLAGMLEDEGVKCYPGAGDLLHDAVRLRVLDGMRAGDRVVLVRLLADVQVAVRTRREEGVAGGVVHVLAHHLAVDDVTGKPSRERGDEAGQAQPHVRYGFALLSIFQR